MKTRGWLFTAQQA